MEDQGFILKKWQTCSQNSIEDGGENDDGYGQQRSMPVVPYVALDVQNDQALNDATNHEIHTSKICLPSNSTEPTNHVSWAAKKTGGIVHQT